MEKVTVAITGASGACYGLRLLEKLLARGCHVDLMISPAAEAFINNETEHHIPSYFEAQKDWINRRFGFAKGIVKLYAPDDWSCPAATGISAARKMVICPASGSALSALATGASNNLIERAGDVALKERNKLILVPRETPYSQIHLENMLKLTQMGAIIVPASPGFQQLPKTVQNLVDFVVERIISQLHFD